MTHKARLQRGLFISFEGGEGAGKSTQIKRLNIALAADGYTVRGVREPGGTKIGEAIRKITNDIANTMLDSQAEALLFAASRAQVVAEVYKPLLAKNQIILADRYIDSSYVYQGLARGLGYKPIKAINDFAIAGLMPDLTFLLDIDYLKGQERRHASTKVDRLDLEKKSFYQTVHQGYRELATQFKSRIIVVNASQDIETIHQIIYDKVKTYIKKHHLNAAE